MAYSVLLASTVRKVAILLSTLATKGMIKTGMGVWLSSEEAVVIPAAKAV